MNGEGEGISNEEIIQKLEFLSRSSNRVQILETLTETARVEKSELKGGRLSPSVSSRSR